METHPLAKKMLSLHEFKGVRFIQKADLLTVGVAVNQIIIMVNKSSFTLLTGNKVFRKTQSIMFENML